MPKISNPENRLTVKEVAQLMGKSQQYIRVGLQRGLLPFGIAFKMENSSFYSYYISPKLFFEYTGKNPKKD